MLSQNTTCRQYNGKVGPARRVEQKDRCSIGVTNRQGRTAVDQSRGVYVAYWPGRAGWARRTGRTIASVGSVGSGWSRSTERAGRTRCPRSTGRAGHASRSGCANLCQQSPHWRIQIGLLCRGPREGDVAGPAEGDGIAGGVGGPITPCASESDRGAVRPRWASRAGRTGNGRSRAGGPGWSSRTRRTL
jgi:hypothetical protein